MTTGLWKTEDRALTWEETITRHGTWTDSLAKLFCISNPRFLFSLEHVEHEP